jgi:hypothetical protein
MSALAVMAIRNEAGYLQRSLTCLIEEGLDLVVIDNGSVDGSREIAEEFLGAGVLQIVDVPWRGAFDLAELLDVKQNVYHGSHHDWHLHVDADEWVRANDNVCLVDFLRGVDSRYSVVNFRECVFVPPTGVDMWGQDYRMLATTYYVFEPRPRWRMLAWRARSVGSNVASGGHQFQDVPEGAIYPHDQTLRHYIGLSWSHAIAKRANRTYRPENLSRGWHANRLDLRAAQPVVASRYLRRAEPWDTRQVDASAPSKYHFWEQRFYLSM